MAKFDSEVAVGFWPQAAEDVYPATLSAIDAAWSFTAGLILGSQTGLRNSGVAFALERSREEGAFIGSSFTRGISTKLEPLGAIRSFTFAFPFVGNRAAAASPPVDANATPISGLDALLIGAGLAGAADPGGVGWLYTFGGTGLPIAALLYLNGNRYQLINCRTSLSIAFTPKAVPVCTATIVGAVDDHKKEGDAGYAAFPTLTYGEQLTVGAPIAVSMGNSWQDSRGWNALTVSVAPSYEAFLDGNAATGEVALQSDREVTLSGTIFSDDTVDKGYEFAQLVEESLANLDPLSFHVGDAMTAGNPAEAVSLTFPKPELVDLEPASVGDKAAAAVELLARGSVGDDELELRFF